ncbi:hypothetical protein [Nocardioides rubriscoriae]|uniref:hypothetical protein n=1 Tax=Nocardioides rubriscoriae TaxID=642762 RepID=UPI0011DF8346|nr:hypothetical protein [Nocardioides rubriscoriae]
MDVRHWLSRAVALTLLTALVSVTHLTATAAGPIPRAAVPKVGTVVMTIRTPAGVPGKVRLTSAGKTRTFTKAARGTTIRVRMQVPVGRWRVSPQQVSAGSALYAGSSTRQVVQVRAGRTSALTVSYTKKASTGTLVLVIDAPDGVPGTVGLQSGSQSRVATKPPAGTSATVRLSVPAGSWRVAPRDVVGESALYAGIADRAVLSVAPGGTATATVAYSAVPSVRDLHVTAIEPTRVQLAWTAPADGAVYVVRRAPGTVAPASATAGSAVPVDGLTATDTEVIAGQTVTYSVFAQSPGSSSWVGPVSTVVTPPPVVVSGETAAVVTDPATVMITDPDQVVTSAAAGRVTVSVPAGRTPVVGQSWVLPPDTDLPTGYLGKVSSVAADGRSVALVPAGLADAFDYLDIDVPSFASLPGRRLGPAGPGARGPDADRGVISCDSGVEGTLAIDRDLDPYGDLHATLTTTEIFGKNIPVGASFDGEFGVVANLEASATIEGSAGCELDLPKLAIWFMAGPVPMVLTAQPTGSVGVSGTVHESVGVTASLGAEFDGYFGLGGDDYIDGRLVTSIDPHADVTVAGDLSLNIGAVIEIGIGSGNPKAGALVGAQATFTALDAHATAVLGQNCLEVSAQRSVSVGLEAKAWLGDHEVTTSLDVPFLNGSADWGSSPWTYPSTCAPAEYRIASGSVQVSSSWSGGCDNDGYCDDSDPETSYSSTSSETSAASLRVADGGGDWVPRFASDPDVRDFLQAPMVFDSWSYDAQQGYHWSGYGCSETWTQQTVGPVQFGGAFWQSGVATAPLADQGLQADLLDYSYGWNDLPVGDWTDTWWWWSLGAWDTDYANEYPRVPLRDSYSGSASCGWEPWQSDVYYLNLENLAANSYWWSPDQARLASSDATTTALDGCTPTACRWQVEGTDTYEFRSRIGECSCGATGDGSTTISWSFVVESREPQPAGRS